MRASTSASNRNPAATESVWVRSVLAGGVGTTLAVQVSQALPGAWWSTLLLLVLCLATWQWLLVRDPPTWWPWIGASCIGALLMSLVIGAIGSEPRLTPLLISACLGAVGLVQAATFRGRSIQTTVSWIAASAAGGAALGMGVYLAGAMLPGPSADWLTLALIKAGLVGGGGLMYGALTGLVLVRSAAVERTVLAGQPSSQRRGRAG
jgi:hypothetical protein